MRPPPLSAALLIFIASPLSHAFAAAPPETIDPATLHRALHLYNVALCLDAPALIVTDLEQISKAPRDGEKLKGPPVADAQTIEALSSHAKSADRHYRRTHALFQVGAQGGEAHKEALADCELCIARARLAWAQGQASATLAWLEHAVIRRLLATRSFGWDSGVGLDERLQMSDALTAAILHAFAVRRSCEALAYDLSDVDLQEPLIKYHKQPEPATAEPVMDGPPRFSTAARMSRQFSTPNIPAVEINSVALKRLLHHLKISACLGLPITSSVEVEQLARDRTLSVTASGPIPLNTEVIQILESRLRWAKRSYQDAKQSHDPAAIKWSAVQRESAAQRLCLAEATLAWAKGDAALAVSWLDRAARWSQPWAANGDDLFSMNQITGEHLSSIDETVLQTTLAALAVRQGCEALGYDLHESALPKLAKIEQTPDRQKTTASAMVTSEAVTSEAVTSEAVTLSRILHVLNVSTCLDLPPLAIFDGRRPVANNPRHGPPSVDDQTHDLVADHADTATSLYLRVNALSQVDATGGELEKLTAAAHRVTFTRARLSWAEGHAGATVAWLDEATHRGAAAHNAMQVALLANVVVLDSCLTAQDIDAKTKLAAWSIRRSCVELGYSLDRGNESFSIPGDLTAHFARSLRRQKNDFWNP